MNNTPTGYCMGGGLGQQEESFGTRVIFLSSGLFVWPFPDPGEPLESQLCWYFNLHFLLNEAKDKPPTLCMRYFPIISTHNYVTRLKNMMFPFSEPQ